MIVNCLHSTRGTKKKVGFAIVPASRISRGAENTCSVCSFDMSSLKKLSEATVVVSPETKNSKVIKKGYSLVEILS